MHDTKCKPLPHLSEKTIARFWYYVDKRGPDECWPWIGSLNKWGYPQFGADKVRRAVRGNRIAYFLHYGVDPFPQSVLHKCDFKPCCNGAHYFLGSRKDNSMDRDAKGRTAKGEKIGTSKLTDDLVREIRKRRLAGEGCNALSREYKLSPGTISLLCARITWKHIE